MSWVGKLVWLIVAIAFGVLGFGILVDVPAAVAKMLSALAFAFFVVHTFGTQTSTCHYPRRVEPGCR